MVTTSRQKFSADALRDAEKFWSEWRLARARGALLPILVLAIGLNVAAVIFHGVLGYHQYFVMLAWLIPANVVALLLVLYRKAEAWAWALPYAAVWSVLSWAMLRNGGTENPLFPAAMLFFFILGTTLQCRLHPAFFIGFVLLNFLAWFGVHHYAPDKVLPYVSNAFDLRGGFLVLAGILALAAFLGAERTLSRRVVGVVAGAIETEIKAASDNQIRQAKDALLSHVSHELLTPLTSVQGYAELLQDPETSPEEVQDFGRRVREQAERAVVAVRNLLDLTALDTGQLKAAHRLVPIREHLEEYVKSHQENFAARQLTLRLYFDDSFPALVETDPEVVNKTLDQLLSNALRFTAKGTVEVVGSLAEDRSLKISVKDSGSGIAEDLRKNLYELFTREAADVTVPIRGAIGLGLALAQRFAHLIGGKVCLEETRIGGGSRFALYLPPTRPRESLPAVS